MLEAKDQGHKRKCTLKKKKRSSQKFFRRSPKIKNEKRSSQKLFKRSPQKNVFQKIFRVLHKILTIQKVVLSSSRGRPIFEDLRPRGQSQGQGLQNVSSRTSSRPRTSSRTPPLKISLRSEMGKTITFWWSWRSRSEHPNTVILKIKIAILKIVVMMEGGQL